MYHFYTTHAAKYSLYTYTKKQGQGTCLEAQDDIRNFEV